MERQKESRTGKKRMCSPAYGARAMRFSRGPCRNFTLVELLIVVTVILILVALLLPALGKARRSGMKASCISNLKQINSGVIQYTLDFEDYLAPQTAGGGTPEQGLDMFLCAPHITYYYYSQIARDNVVRQRKSIAQCADRGPLCAPPEHTAYSNYNLPEFWSGKMRSSYGYNVYAFGSYNDTGRAAIHKTVSHKRPSETFTFADAESPYCRLNQGSFYKIVMNHFSGTNYGFLDGHASTIVYPNYADRFNQPGYTWPGYVNPYSHYGAAQLMAFPFGAISTY